MRPSKIQISLRIRAVWSESPMGAFSIAKDRKFLHADNQDSDQTARMRKLIWVRWAHRLGGTFFHVSGHCIALLTTKLLALYCYCNGKRFARNAICANAYVRIFASIWNGYHESWLCHVKMCIRAYADNEGPDQPVQPHSPIRAVTVRL